MADRQSPSGTEVSASPLPSLLRSIEEFDAIDLNTWRERVEADLGGRSIEEALGSRTPEGITIHPLYAEPAPAGGKASARPGVAPFIRGSRPPGAARWLCVAHHRIAEAAELGAALRQDVTHGADAIAITLDAAGEPPPSSLAAAGGSRPSGPGGSAGRIDTRVICAADLDRVLDGVRDRVRAVFLEPGWLALPAAATLRACMERAQHAASSPQLLLGADPIGTLAREGTSAPFSFGQAEREATALALACAHSWPEARAMCVSTAPYHLAGADAIHELAIAAATTVHYLRRLAEAGLDLDRAAHQIILELTADGDIFMTVAKLRAMRWIWSRLLEASGCAPAAPFLHVKTSERSLALRDREVNILRTTTQVFAAAVAGADAITAWPFDLPMGRSTAASRRLARNTQTILSAEAHLERVADAAGGSYYIEALTHELARKAWSLFQEIERNGGMADGVVSGRIAEMLEEISADRLDRIRRRRLATVGVSHFARLDEPRPHPYPSVRGKAVGRTPVAVRSLDDEPAADWLDHLTRFAAAGASIPELSGALPRSPDDGPSGSVAPLPCLRDAAPWESLRDAADDLAQRSRRPQVFLACLGPAAEHRSRASLARQVIEAGGLEATGGETPADTAQSADELIARFRAEKIPFACLVGSDERLADEGPAVAGGLRSAGARLVLAVVGPGAVAGEGPPAGLVVDGNIAPGEDAWEVLARLLQAAGASGEVAR